MTSRQPPLQRPSAAGPPPVRAEATTHTDVPRSGTGAAPTAAQTSLDTAVVATTTTEPVATIAATNSPVATAAVRSVASGHADQPSSGTAGEPVASAPSAARTPDRSPGWVIRALARGWRASARAVRRLCISGPLLLTLAVVFALADDEPSGGWVVSPIARILPAQGQQIPIAQNLDQVLTGLRNLLMLYLVPVTIVILTAAWMRYGASRKAENAEQAKEAVSKALIGFCGAALSPLIVEVLRLIVRGAS